ncbi:MAG: nuclear transport factor 2 family protein [Hyphomicrobiaceae bacterium]|nr:nuclear transport factor 2 family protein [Hyphomicrobiaceae bacterium]
MSIALPVIIDLYFATENAHHASAIEQCFASGAVVHDEGKLITGVEAIKAWRIETREKYHHTVEPLSVATRDGKVVVTSKVSGNFPGSPINLDYNFEIVEDLVVSLEIRP